ncbi:hypothetical protein JB92DRAFT_648620 [Gautieria morchelliformis]|nr:hypothetical protein JB92DRAFT_648620 [Gautieria morchelliformis]
MAPTATTSKYKSGDAEMQATANPCACHFISHAASHGPRLSLAHWGTHGPHRCSQQHRRWPN